jgi:nucleotide-binding universal stress UspA family protein
MTRILVGMDNSEASRTALAWAAHVARAFGAEVRVVHAYVPVQSEKRPGLLERLTAERAAELDTWCDDLLDGVSNEREVIVGEASDVLPDAAERLDADLIVVARTGESGREPGLFRIGSVVEHLAHRVVRPLAVIAPGTPSVTSRIVVGVDGSDHGRPAVRWTAHFAEATGARTTPVTVAEPERSPADLDAAEDVVRSEWQAPTELLDDIQTIPVPTIPVADALIDATSDLGADLLVVGATGLGAITNARIGGTAMGVLHRTERSMVLVPDD